MSLLDDARTLLEKLDRGGDGPWAPGGEHHSMICLACGTDIRKEYQPPDCPWNSMPKIVAALESADDCAGLLLMVLDNQIRNGWVKEGSPLLDEPRKALERWHALKG